MKASHIRSALMLGILVCAATPCAEQSLSRASRPEVKVGDAWVYKVREVRTGETRELSFLMSAVEADRIVTETGSSTSGAWTFTREWNPVERKTGDVISMSIAPSWPITSRST
jgi:hypothetical protein